MAGCHTLLICENLCNLWENILRQKLLCNLWEDIPHLSFLCVPRILWEDSLVAAWVWQGCHTLLICVHPCNLWENILRQKFFAICGRIVMLVHVCFVGAAETAAPSWVADAKSALISLSLRSFVVYLQCKQYIRLWANTSIRSPTGASSDSSDRNSVSRC